MARDWIIDRLLVRFFIKPTGMKHFFLFKAVSPFLCGIQHAPLPVTETTMIPIFRFKFGTDISYTCAERSNTLLAGAPLSHFDKKTLWQLPAAQNSIQCQEDQMS
ncbi:MAG: hypothetical protein R3A45_04100 [Bdellovibrionota bacterium]